MANACLLSETTCLKGWDDNNVSLEVASGVGRFVEVAGGTGRLVEVTWMGRHMRGARDGWGSGDPGIPRTCGPREQSGQYLPVTRRG